MRIAKALRTLNVDVRQAAVYLVVPDESASAHGMIRIVDGSGESYLYPAREFQVKD